MPDAMTGHHRSPLLLARGLVDDAEALRRSWDDWHRRIGLDDRGWLGSTGGIAATGQWFAAVRFSSMESARATRDAAEAVAGLLSHAADVELTADISFVEGNGSPEGARFVQFMRARVPDRRRLEEVEAAVGDRFAAVRPDFLSGLRAWTGDDRLTVVDWFTSESDARAGEAAGIPEDLGALFGEWMSLLHDVEWHDVVEPWQVSPEASPRH